MDQMEITNNIGSRIRRIWSAVYRLAEAMSRSGVDDLYDRIEYLESEVVALKNKNAAKR